MYDSETARGLFNFSRRNDTIQPAKQLQEAVSAQVVANADQSNSIQNRDSGGVVIRPKIEAKNIDSNAQDSSTPTLIYKPGSTQEAREVDSSVNDGNQLKSLIRKYLKHYGAESEDVAEKAFQSAQDVLENHIRNLYADRASKEFNFGAMLEALGAHQDPTMNVSLNITVSDAAAGTFMAVPGDQSVTVGYDGNLGIITIEGTRDAVQAFVQKVYFYANVTTLKHFWIDLRITPSEQPGDASSKQSESPLLSGALADESVAIGQSITLLSARILMLYDKASGFYVAQNPSGSAGTAQLESPLITLITPQSEEITIPLSKLSESQRTLFEAIEAPSETNHSILFGEPIAPAPPIVEVTPPDPVEPNEPPTPTDPVDPPDPVEPNEPVDTPPTSNPPPGLPPPPNTPPVANDATFAIDENSVASTGVGTVIATDADVGDTLSYAITAGNTDVDGDGNDAFSINGGTGEIAVNDADDLDFETNPTFNLTVEVSDDGTPVENDTAIITVNVNDVIDLTPAVNDNLGSSAGGDAFSGIAANWHTSDTVDGGAGDDTLTITSGSVNITIDAGNYTGFEEVETLVLPDDTHSITLDDDYFARGTGPNSDTFTINATAASGDVTIDGGALSAPNALNATTGSGDDTLTGGAGDDTLNGGTGNDTINGGTGSDIIHAGGGDDEVSLSINSFASLDDLPSLNTGHYTITADGQSINGYVEYDGTDTWFLVGRGRENWEFDADGQGLVADVSQNLGTTGAFAPAAYSNTIINDIIDNSGDDLTDVEIRIKRAADTTGSTYQEVRWNPLTQTTWTWDFPGVNYDVEHHVAASTLGAAFTDLTSNTRDTMSTPGSDTGNNYQRIWTFNWGGKANIPGFSYGSAVSGVNGNDANTFLWENTSENHATPYTEIYIRLENAMGGGGSSDDTLFGGAGNDTLTNTVNTLTTTLDGTVIREFETLDLRSVNAAHNVTVTDAYFAAGVGVDGNLFTVNANGNATGITLDGSALTGTYALSVNGSNGGDNVSSGEGDDSLTGNDGNDTIASGAGDDTITGGNGNDSITGASGQDTISGDLGNDTIMAGSGNDTAYGGDGNDSITGGSGDDVVQGNDGNDTITGGSGVDSLEGGAAKDILEGGADSDTIDGGADNDVLNGGDAGDSLDGSAGDDILYGDDGFFEQTAGLIVIEAENHHGLSEGNGHFWEITDYAPASGGQVLYIDDQGAEGGNGSLQQVANYSVNFTSAGTFYVWVLGTTGLSPGATGQDDSLLIGLDGVNLSGAFPTGVTGYNEGLLWNTLATRTTMAIAAPGEYTLNLFAREDGFAADKILITNNAGFTPAGAGPLENARIVTSGGNDTINGGEGDDTIYGDLGSDTIIGGLGEDCITGGADADTFVFEAINESQVGARDVITDFQTGSDTIDLLALGLAFNVVSANGTAGGGTADFTVGPGGPEIAWGQVGGNTVIYIDTDGDDAANMEIELTGLLSLDGGDFVS